VVFEKKQLSKVLAIALMVACAVAFMPLLGGDVFAAKKAKGPKITKKVYTVKTQKVTVKWKKNKKAKSYQVKVGTKKAKNVKKSKTSYSVKYAQKETAQKITIKVRAKVGKSWTKWSAAKLTIPAKEAPKTALKGVKITVAGAAPTAIHVGDTLTAAVDPAEATATYQWSRVSGDAIITPIEGATAVTYTVQAADIGSKIQVAATGTEDFEGSVTEMTQVAVAKDESKADVYLENPDAPILVGNPVTFTINTAKAVTFAWYEDGVLQPGESGNSYTPKTAGAKLTCKVTVDGVAVTPNPINNVTIAAKDIAADYDAVIEHLDADGKAKTGDVEYGDTLKASVVSKADPEKTYAGAAYSWAFKYQLNDEEKTVVDATCTGATLALKAGATYTIKYVDENGNEQTVNNVTAQDIAKANQGGDFVVTATIAQSKDYAGSVSASIKAGSEVASTVTLKDSVTTARLGDTITVDTVTGNLGNDMTTSVTISWKALVPNPDGSSSWQVLGTGLSLEVTRDVFDSAITNGIYATVDGTTAKAGPVNVVKTPITEIALNTETYVGHNDMLPAGEALAYKLLTTGAVEVTNAIAATDYEVAYEINGVEATAADVQSMIAGNTYKVTVTPANPASEYFDIPADGRTASATAGPAKETYTLSIKVRAENYTEEDPQYKDEPYSIGDVLRVEGTFPATYVGYVPAQPTWYVDSVSEKNKIKKSDTLTIAPAYVGHKIVAVSDGATGNGTPAGKYFKEATAETAQAIAKADLNLSVSPVTYKVGATVTASAAQDEDASFKWYAVSPAGEAELTPAEDAVNGNKVVLPASASGTQLKVVATPCEEKAATYNETSKQFTAEVGPVDGSIVITAAIEPVEESVTGNYEIGDVFKLDINQEDAIDQTKVEWYRNGEKVSTGATYTLSNNDAEAGVEIYADLAEAKTTEYKDATAGRTTNSIFYDNDVWTLTEPVTVKSITVTPISYTTTAAQGQTKDIEVENVAPNNIRITDSNDEEWTVDDWRAAGHEFSVTVTGVTNDYNDRPAFAGYDTVNGEYFTVSARWQYNVARTGSVQCKASGDGVEKTFDIDVTVNHG
jgi:hypothetical protein